MLANKAKNRPAFYYLVLLIMFNFESHIQIDINIESLINEVSNNDIHEIINKNKSSLMTTLPLNWNYPSYIIHGISLVGHLSFTKIRIKRQVLKYVLQNICTTKRMVLTNAAIPKTVAKSLFKFSHFQILKLEFVNSNGWTI